MHGHLNVKNSISAQSSYPLVAQYIYIYILNLFQKKLIVLFVTTFASSGIHFQSCRLHRFSNPPSVIICNIRVPRFEHCCQTPYNCQRGSSSCLLAYSTHYNSYTYFCHLQLSHVSIFFFFDSSVPKQQVSPPLSATNFHESQHISSCMNSDVMLFIHCD